MTSRNLLYGSLLALVLPLLLPTGSTLTVLATRGPRGRTSTMAPEESSAAGAKPAARNAVSTSPIGAGDTATVGARGRNCTSSVAGAATACASSAGSSQRTNDAAIPIGRR